MEVSENKKVKYGMWSNVCYMIQQAWKSHKSVLFLIFAWIGFDMTINLLQLFIVPILLNKMETHVSLEELIKIILLFTAGLTFAGAGRAYIQRNQLFGRIGVRIEILMKIHDKINNTSYSNLEEQKFMKLREKARRSTSGNNEATEAIWHTLTNLLKNSLGFFLYFYLLSKVHFFIILLTILTASIGYFLTAQANTWRYRHEKDVDDLYHKLNYISTRIRDRTFAKDIRIFQMKNWLSDLYQSFLKKLQLFYIRRECIYFGSDLAETILHFIRSFTAFVYLTHLVLQGEIHASEFLLYFSAVNGFTTWITGIFSEFAILNKQSFDISLIREFLEYQEPFHFQDGKTITPVKGETYEIELQNVSFRYLEAKQNTLKHINLKLKKGEKLALVGLNGAGKTTLIKLICGFYDPTEGCVKINGQDIRQYNRSDYYRHFSAVFQDFSLFAGSIAVNVAQTDEKIDMEKVKTAIEKAGLKKKIERLPLNYNTHLGKEVFDDAVELSGGEMQRLMLARALYKEAPIILLDEPTSALDPLVESDMYQRYYDLTKGCTSIYISHRLASTRFCDRVILLDKGEIIEEGTHESLMAANGTYAHLYHLQSQYYQK